MPGVRAPQPPTSGPPARTRRRNSLPALSSAQLNRLSANASNTKTHQGVKNGLTKSLPEENSQKPVSNINEKTKSTYSVNPTKPLKPVAKIIVSKDASLDTNGNELNGENNISPTGTEESDDNSPVPNGSSILQKRVQSKTNAVFIFRFEDDDDKSKKTKSSDSSLLSTVITDKSLSPKPIKDFKSDLNNTWPPESLDINSYKLNSVRFNTLGFCGYKHKQFRDSRKLCHIMTPVQELRTPVDDTEFDLDDEWSMSSSTDHWMDTRSSNGSYSPGTHRGRDEIRRRAKHIQINANSNTFLSTETDSNLSSNLRSALSLSPRRNSRSTLNTLRTSNSKSKSSSSQRLRSDLKGGGSESTVGQIFNSLRQNGNNTSKSSSISNTLSSGDDYEPRTQLPARLQARRRSLSSLPDLVKMKGTSTGSVKR